MEEELNKAMKTIQDLNNTIKRSNIKVIWHGMERKIGLEDVFNEIIKGNFPNIGNVRGCQIQEGQRTPDWIRNNAHVDTSLSSSL